MKSIALIIFLFVASSSGHICELYLYSPEHTKHYSYFPLTSNTIEFNVRSPADAHILLSLANSYNDIPTYEIVLGTQKNTFSIIRKNGKDVARYDGGILSDKTFRSFKIVSDPDTASITVIGHGNTKLMSYTDSEFVKMTKFGFASYHKNSAEFQYRCDQTYDHGSKHVSIF